MRELTKKILFQINILMAAGILLSYASNFLSPDKIWPLAFFGLAYPLLLILNISFFVLWLWRRNKFALLSLIVILIGAEHIGRYFQLQFSKTENTALQKNIKILSFNVRVFNNYDFTNSSVSRDSIGRYINSQNADIVCLQEYLTRAHLQSQNEEHTSKLLAGDPFRHIQYTLTTPNNARKFGIATYSKYPIVNKGSIKFSNSYNSCIYSDIKVGSDIVRVYNVHLQSISLKKDYSVWDSLAYINSKRIDEVKDISGRLKNAFIQRAEQVNAVRDHMNQSPYPVVLCGDFNDSPVSYSYRQLLGEKKDTYREAGNGIGKTYAGKIPAYRIDYIFHDNAFNTLKYETPKVYLSDHYPVICVLDMK